MDCDDEFGKNICFKYTNLVWACWNIKGEKKNIFCHKWQLYAYDRDYLFFSWVPGEFSLIYCATGCLKMSDWCLKEKKCKYMYIMFLFIQSGKVRNCYIQFEKNCHVSVRLSIGGFIWHPVGNCTIFCHKYAILEPN